MFLVAIAAVAGTGAAGVSRGIIPMPNQMVQAVHALGGDPARIKRLELNPIRATYDNVMRQVTSPGSSERLGFHGSAVLAPDFSAVLNPTARPVPTMQNGFAPAITSQTQQFNNRMRDLRGYAGNPNAWHGAPPH